METTNSDLIRQRRQSKILSTDEAFEPLRRSIIKSFHDHSLTLSKSISNLSNRIHCLSTTEAEKLSKEIYISNEPELVGTSKMHLVEGKEFWIVNVEELEYRPLSEE